MEALSRLQSVQATLQLMQEYSLRTDGGSSDLFVADFLLFLTQNCTDAKELLKRSVTLINFLPEVSYHFLQALVGGEATPAEPVKNKYRVEIPSSVGDEHTWEIGNSSSPTATGRPKAGENRAEAASMAVEDCPLPTASIAHDEFTEHRWPLKAAPSIGLKAMEKARSTLEDFCRSYFMFHDMDARNPVHVFKYLPILQFVESYIYDLDEINEDKLHQSVQVVGTGALGRSYSQRSIDEPQETAYCITEDNSAGAAYVQICSDEEKEASDGGLNGLRLEVDPLGDLRDVLYSKGLMTERIEAELRDGVEYWKLERKLCGSVTMGTKVTMEDVFKTIELKSFDFRILNHLLYSLTHRMVNETHMEFLRVAEFLVEIADDLFDYEDDVRKNSFNVLRMLVYVCGPTEAPAVLANFISTKETKYQQLLDKLEPSLAKRFQERCKEAAKEGGGDLQVRVLDNTSSYS
ncbi:hypothetical protein Mapa_011298 [Marchantia paleacea]|nr:hypothetical protein Mapa_011298 [Marchantia paleacea]